jgi:hypothetical protein
MRKIALTLAVLLLATPAFAAVRIIIEDESGGIAAIKYETDGEMVRAFALDISVSDGQTIEAISDYLKGESTAATPGYGIFPANFGDYIEVDADTGEVTTWDVNEYTPLADPNDPGADGTGLGTSAVVIEMGALYYPADDSSPNAPPTSGTLCKLEVSGTCTMSATENSIRGGVVLTDPDVAADVDTTAATAVTITVDDCPFSTTSECDEWVAMGSPASWVNPRQCHGDADGAQDGNPKSGYFWVWSSDLNALLAGWKQPYSGDPEVDPWISADFSHSEEGNPKSGYFRVWAQDLNILLEYWKQADVPEDCLD